MLYMVLCAHGGVLPDYVFVVFANTGKEREETLRFVHECGVRWGVHIWWLERADDDGAGVAPADRFHVVGYNSASRTGEPFKAFGRASCRESVCQTVSISVFAVSLKKNIT